MTTPGSRGSKAVRKLGRWPTQDHLRGLVYITQVCKFPPKTQLFFSGGFLQNTCICEQIPKQSQFQVQGSGLVPNHFQVHLLLQGKKAQLPDCRIVGPGNGACIHEEAEQS